MHHLILRLCDLGNNLCYLLQLVKALIAPPILRTFSNGLRTIHWIGLVVRVVILAKTCHIADIDYIDIGKTLKSLCLYFCLPTMIINELEQSFLNCSLNVIPEYHAIISGMWKRSMVFVEFLASQFFSCRMPIILGVFYPFFSLQKIKNIFWMWIKAILLSSLGRFLFYYCWWVSNRWLLCYRLH